MWRRVMAIQVKANAPAERVRAYEHVMREAPRRVPGVAASWVAPNVAGRSEWTHAWDMAFDSFDAIDVYRKHPYHTGDLPAFVTKDDGVVEKLAFVRFEPFAGETPEPGIRDCLKRSLIMAVRPGTPEDKVREFERSLTGMPEYIKGIRNWAMSRVTEQGGWPPAPGASPWTHVWEQEFRDMSGIQEYMDSAYHWGYVDLFFDRDGPYNIVDRWIHVYSPMPSSILAWRPQGAAARV